VVVGGIRVSILRTEKCCDWPNVSFTPPVETWARCFVLFCLVLSFSSFVLPSVAEHMLSTALGDIVCHSVPYPHQCVLQCHIDWTLLFAATLLNATGRRRCVFFASKLHIIIVLR
jgi:hypothetical protein